MTFSTSYLNRLHVLWWLLFVLLAGCATLEPGPPALQVDALQMVLRGAATEKLGQLDWNVQFSDAQGAIAVELWSRKQSVESLEYSGSLASGNWLANKPGSYQFKAIVSDELGRVADSGWSETFLFKPAFGKDSLYAVLPIENLSDSRAPVDEIHHTLFEMLTEKGLRLLDQTDLENFMRYRRMRHVGGISSQLGEQFRRETGVDGVLLTSLETWQESSSPRVSIIMRLVMTGDNPEIVWIDSVGLTGEDSPGLLGIGLIKDSQKLLVKGLARLLGSFQDYLDGQAPEYRHASKTAGSQLLNAGNTTADEALKQTKKRLQPQFFYRASNFVPDGQYKVAVIPFLNINARKHAGKIVALHIVKQLHRYANIRVFEPGLVRQTLLRYRMIMQSGPSLAASDVLSNNKILGADLVVSGKVFDFQGDVGESKVDFSIQAFDGSKREVVWTSRSYATGNAGVYFYNFGKIPSAHGLVSRMTQAVIMQLEE